MATIFKGTLYINKHTFSMLQTSFIFYDSKYLLDIAIPIINLGFKASGLDRTVSDSETSQP
jgi:hypothetical protein